MQPWDFNKRLLDTELIEPHSDTKDYPDLANFLSIEFKGETLLSVNLLKQLVVEFNRNSFFQSYGYEARRLDEDTPTNNIGN